MTETAADMLWWFVFGIFVKFAAATFRSSLWTGRADNTPVRIIEGPFSLKRPAGSLAAGGGSLSDRLDSLSGSLDAPAAKLDAFEDSLRTGYAEIRADIDNVLEQLPPQTAANSQSRIVHSEFGREISAAAEAEMRAHANAPKFVVDSVGKGEFETYDLCAARAAHQFADDARFQPTARPAGKASNWFRL